MSQEVRPDDFRLTHPEFAALMDAPFRGKPKRKDPLPRGHYMKPGTGPEGKTCADCAHIFRNELAKTYLKCGKARAIWTGGRASDIRAKDAACSGFEAAP